MTYDHTPEPTLDPDRIPPPSPWLRCVVTGPGVVWLAEDPADPKEAK